jgi:hypothetical protein
LRKFLNNFPTLWILYDQHFRWLIVHYTLMKVSKAYLYIDFVQTRQYWIQLNRYSTICLIDTLNNNWISVCSDNCLQQIAFFLILPIIGCFSIIFKKSFFSIHFPFYWYLGQFEFDGFNSNFSRCILDHAHKKLFWKKLTKILPRTFQMPTQQ